VAERIDRYVGSVITLRFPSMLHARAGRELTFDESCADLGTLLDALDRRIPGLTRELADPIYNIAVNDEMLLHGVRAHPLKDGDVVEIVPTISGG
jgi:molybdopterin converting factor small subunit